MFLPPRCWFDAVLRHNSINHRGHAERSCRLNACRAGRCDGRGDQVMALPSASMPLIRETDANGIMPHRFADETVQIKLTTIISSLTINFAEYFSFHG